MSFFKPAAAAFTSRPIAIVLRLAKRADEIGEPETTVTLTRAGRAMARARVAEVLSGRRVTHRAYRVQHASGVESGQAVRVTQASFNIPLRTIAADDRAERRSSTKPQPVLVAQLTLAAFVIRHVAFLVPGNRTGTPRRRARTARRNNLGARILPAPLRY